MTPADLPSRRAAPSGTRAHLPAIGLGVAVLLWGTSFVATKSALAGFPPWTVIGVRMLLASAVMLPLWPRVPTPPSRRAGDGRRILVLAAIYPTAYYAAESQAVNLTTSAQAGTVSAIAPLIVAAGAWVFLGERLRRRAIAGLLVSIGGVVVLSLGAGAANASAPNPALGNALEMLAISFAAVSTIILKGLSVRWNAWRLTGLQMLFAAVVFLPFAVMTPPATWGNAPVSSWIALFYLGVVLTLFPSGLYNVAVTHMPAAQAAMAINLIPALAIIAGWLVLGEQMTPVQWVACGVILAGVLLGQMGGGAAVAPPAAAPSSAVS